MFIISALRRTFDRCNAPQSLARRRPQHFAPTVLGACLVVLVGCTTLPPLERQQLIEASRQCSAGNPSGPVADLDRIIRDYGQAAEIAEAHYIRGLCRFGARQVDAAADDFRQAIVKSRRSDLTARCRASLAAIAVERGEWERAADLYGQAVGDLPDAPPIDAVLVQAGIAMQRAGKWRDAETQFARVLNRFRNRPSAEQARRLAMWRQPYFSIQYGAYRDLGNADKAVQELRQQGLDPAKVYLPRDGQPMWIITAGQYRTYDEALSALARARKQQPQANIVP